MSSIDAAFATDDEDGPVSMSEFEFTSNPSNETESVLSRTALAIIAKYNALMLDSTLR